MKLIKITILHLILLINTCCFGDITPTTYQRFLREYAETKENGKFNWSEVAFAVEMNYDEIALYCLDRLPLGNIDYTCFGTQRRNLLLDCVKKNKMDILIAILNKYPDIKANGSQYVVNQGKIGPPRIQEEQILNMAIQRDNALKWVKLLADFGADLNKSENHFIFPNSIGYKSHDRTPLQEAIFRNKLDILEFFLDQGVNPDTGLYMAVVTRRNLEALVILLNYGANPYAYNGSIFNEAIELEDTEIVDILTSICRAR